MDYLKKGLSFYLYFHKNQLQGGPSWWIYAWFGLLIFFLSIHAPITCDLRFTKIWQSWEFSIIWPYSLLSNREKPFFWENHPPLEMFFPSSENPFCCFYNHFIPVHFPYVNGALGTYLIFSIHITHEGT